MDTRVLFARIGWMQFYAGALEELTADKLPNTPARTAPVGLIARIVAGCLCGVAVPAAPGIQTFRDGHIRPHDTILSNPAFSPNFNQVSGVSGLVGQTPQFIGAGALDNV